MLNTTTGDQQQVVVSFFRLAGKVFHFFFCSGMENLQSLLVPGKVRARKSEIINLSPINFVEREGGKKLLGKLKRFLVTSFCKVLLKLVEIPYGF